MPQEQPAGTRERRRLATSAAIERIAVDLALEHGSDQVTVDMICERGMISHRTFYNYFPSKDAAIVGNGPPPASGARVAAFCASNSADVVEELIDLLVSPLLEAGGDEHGPVANRRMLLEREPQLFEKAMQRFGDFMQELSEVVLARLERAGRTTDETPDLREEAEMIVALAGAVMHRASHELFKSGGEGDPREMLARSADLARRVLSKGTR